MNKLKNIIGKILDIPTSYILTSIIVLTLIAIGVTGDNSTLLGAFSLIVIGGLILLQIKLGPIVIKSIISIFMILYTTSLYVYLVSELHFYIIQPFLLTIAAITSFLAITYTSYNLSLRSRPLWSAMLSIILVSIKAAFILSDFSYLVAEIIGLNVLVIFVVTWYYWANNSKKSKIIKPKVIKEEIINEYKYIYIEDKLNVELKTWPNNSKKMENAYPYIYTEIMKAKENKLTTIFISSTNTDKVYDVGYVNVNKIRIPYLYMEAKENIYVDRIISEFEREILIK